MTMALSLTGIGLSAWNLSMAEVRALTAVKVAQEGEEQARIAAAVMAGMSADPKAYEAWVRARTD